MKRTRLYDLLLISLFAALISACSFISIPAPIPFTLQTFALFTALMTLGGKSGIAAVMIYISLGLVGLPIFSSFGSGVGYLMGASGGFIIGFAVAAALFLLFELLFGFGKKRRFIYAAVGQAAIYISGTLWFSLVFGGADSLGAALLLCVLPYLIPDAIKLFLAYFISARLVKIRTRT